MVGGGDGGARSGGGCLVGWLAVVSLLKELWLVNATCVAPPPSLFGCWPFVSQLTAPRHGNCHASVVV
jgi:hypothetical protein